MFKIIKPYFISNIYNMAVRIGADFYWNSLVYHINFTIFCVS